MLNLLEFDVLIWIATNLLYKCVFVGLKIVQLDEVFRVVPLGHSYGRLTIVGDHAAHDCILCCDILTLSEPREDIVKILESLIWLDILISIGSQSLLLLLNFKHLLVVFELLLELGLHVLQVVELRLWLLILIVWIRLVVLRITIIIVFARSGLVHGILLGLWNAKLAHLHAGTLNHNLVGSALASKATWDHLGC